jgi:protein-S-isoprenylcysteine O-methyltransferase Ste14
MSPRLYKKVLKYELIKIVAFVLPALMIAQSWAYWHIALYFVTSFVSLVLVSIFLVAAPSESFKNSTPIVVQDIQHSRPEPKREFWVAYWLVFSFISIVASVDAMTGGSPLVSGRAFYIGLAVCLILVNILLARVIGTNAAFQKSVDGQEDASPLLVISGPYAVVRHPGYLSGALATLLTSLILGSAYSLIPALINVIMLIGRTRCEDNKLSATLDGYREYKAHVRHVLIPGVW